MSHHFASLFPRFQTRVVAGPVPDIGIPHGEAVALVEADHVVVWLHGDIDTTLADELSQLLDDLDELHLPVVLDGSHVTFCDSAGLRFVLRLMSSGLQVTLRQPSEALRLLLDALDAFVAV